MSRPTPRKPASSRGQTPRPRRIAGQSGGSVPPTTGETPDDSLSDDLSDVPVDLPKATVDDLGSIAQGEDPIDFSTREGLLERRRTSQILIIALSVITLILIGQVAFWLLRDNDDAPARATDDSSLTVPKGRPVVAASLQWREGVDAAAKAAQELVSVDYTKYDEEVAAAVKVTTARYEKEYLKVLADVKDQGVALQLKVQASVVAQGVVRANRTRLEALVFLNQVVERVRDGKKETVVTPYRALLTMVHTDHGWLVDSLETDDLSAAPKSGATDGATSAPSDGEPDPTDAPSSGTQDNIN